MIRGKFIAGSPTIEGLLSFPGLSEGADHPVTFLLDTGAQISVLHPRDSRRLGLQPDRLTGDRVRGVGIGGTAEYVLTEGILRFAHTEPPTLDADTMVAYRVPFRVALLDRHNSWYPSILEMDFIGHFRMVISLRTNTVELE